MKKRSILFVACLGILTLQPAVVYGSGFTGPSGPPPHITSERHSVTVSRARNLRDDSKVVLQGRILRAVGNEKYIFADNTGEITVEIDAEVWRDLSVSENDLVEIYGEIDRDDRRVEVDVKFIRRI